MPKFPGFPEKPHYNSVKAYLSELAKDIAEMVVEPVKMERFKEQLKIYADSWKQWSNYDEADRQGCWEPSMGRPECIFNIFSRSYNPLRDTEKGAKRLAGSYALCALIHDSQLPHLDKINTDIIPVEAVQETFSAPRNTLEARLVGNWNSGPDVREIYLIEEFFNRVTVDLREFCKSEENKLTQTSIEGQIQQASQLSDEEFLELTAKKFEERAKKVLSKDETWHDLDRSLKVWFGAAIERLEKHGFKNKTDLLKYLYKNLLHYAREVNIKNFRGFPDSRIVELAYSKASELAERFKEATRKNKENLPPNKTEENESGVIVDLLKKDYLLKTEDSFKEETAGIVQDFISRGLYNSTACTSKQLQAHFDHINKLLDHILESLKKDFADIPLKQIKEKLLTITDEEYKKLVPIANSHLVNAGLAQQSTLESLEQQINNKKKKVKQTIETRLAISEKQRASPKDKRDLAETGQGNKDSKKEDKGIITPKPPEFLQNVLWILKYGRKHWKVITLAVVILVVAFYFKVKLKNNDSISNINKAKELEKQVQKAKEIALPPTLSFLKEKINIVKSDTGYMAILVFKPSKNRPPLGPTGFSAKVKDTSNAKIIDFDDIGSDHVRTLSKKISNDGKEALFTYDPGHFEYPKIKLKTSDTCRVQISSSHIPEPFFVDIE